jgi:hypothetical protein
MTKKDKVDGLIANHGWAEADREWLMSLDEPRLDRMAPKEKKAEAIVNEVKAVLVPPPEAPKPVTFQDLIANADPAVRDQFQDMQASYAVQKAELVKTITANKANTFTAEYLNTKPVSELKAIAALAAPPPSQGVQKFISPVYAGAAGGAPTFNQDDLPDDEKEMLPVPTVNWAAK